MYLCLNVTFLFCLFHKVSKLQAKKFTFGFVELEFDLSTQICVSIVISLPEYCFHSLHITELFYLALPVKNGKA